MKKRFDILAGLFWCVSLLFFWLAWRCATGSLWYMAVGMYINGFIWIGVGIAVWRTGRME